MAEFVILISMILSMVVGISSAFYSSKRNVDLREAYAGRDWSIRTPLSMMLGVVLISLGFVMGGYWLVRIGTVGSDLGESNIPNIVFIMLGSFGAIFFAILGTYVLIAWALSSVHAVSALYVSDQGIETRRPFRSPVFAAWGDVVRISESGPTSTQSQSSVEIVYRRDDSHGTESLLIYDSSLGLEAYIILDILRARKRDFDLMDM
ncbi:hypothetical protein [Gordonia sp. (in: high G+C Gram-positive bacteria)]|uniref:hypothetical protein n=1 Tax=Gordonia sp. (in: high G+C Gram-positive bacteria) TaxID=84139 RepID=UPI003C72458E